MNDPDVLFIGGLYPAQIENEIRKNSIAPMQNAANVHQHSLIEGLDSAFGRPVDIISLPFVGSFPRRYKKPYIKKLKFSHNKGAEDVSLGFLNITVLKKFCGSAVLKRAAQEWISTKTGKKVIIMYSVQNMHLSLAKMIKRHYKDVHLCLIVPDLPLYFNIDKKEGWLQKIYTNYSVKKGFSHIDYFDSFVFLTKYMSEYYGTKKPHVIIEGIAKDPGKASEDKAASFMEGGNKYIVYTGTLGYNYGVLDLVNAFFHIKKDNYRLVICGGGEAAAKIKSFSESDRRIIFLGMLPHSEVLAIQQRAMLLVEPRPKDERAKYFFPSKLLEYMLSGVPVICHKLASIPDEYDGYLHYFKSDDPYEMAEQMVEICESDEKERLSFGERSRSFALQEKNSAKAGEKIANMIKGALR